MDSAPLLPPSYESKPRTCRRSSLCTLCGVGALALLWWWTATPKSAGEPAALVTTPAADDDDHDDKCSDALFAELDAAHADLREELSAGDEADLVALTAELEEVAAVDDLVAFVQFTDLTGDGLEIEDAFGNSYAFDERYQLQGSAAVDALAELWATATQGALVSEARLHADRARTRCFQCRARRRSRLCCNSDDEEAKEGTEDELAPALDAAQLCGDALDVGGLTPTRRSVSHEVYLAAEDKTFLWDVALTAFAGEDADTGECQARCVVVDVTSALLA